MSDKSQVGQANIFISLIAEVSITISANQTEFLVGTAAVIMGLLGMLASYLALS